MSGHVRFGFAALLLVAGLSTSAASDPITDLLSRNAAPEAATAAPAAAPAAEACLPQPGNATAPGQRWVYRHEGHRKCWFQAAAGTALAKKPVHHHAERQRVAAPEQNTSAPRKQEAVEDARDEMLSSAPAETPQPTPPAPAPNVVPVHVVPVRVAPPAAQVAPAPVAAKPAADQLAPDQLTPPAPTLRAADATPAAAAQVPPPPVLARPGADQPASDQPTPRRVDVERLLGDAPAASDQAASVPPATPVAGPGAEADGGGGWTTNWLGVLLMALGFVALLSASRTLRRALWPARARDPEQRSQSSRPTGAAVSPSVGVHPVGQRRARRAV